MKTKKAWGSVRFYKRPESGRGSAEHMGTKIAMSRADADRALEHAAWKDAVRAEIIDGRGGYVAILFRDGYGNWIAAG